MNRGRRHFVKNTLPLAMLAMHDAGFGYGNILNDVGPEYNYLRNTGLLNHVELLTSTPMDELRKFYVHKLELRAINYSQKKMTIQVGESRLTFVHADNIIAPFYHFAFNIPENQIEAALRWQRSRSSIINSPHHMVDKKYSSYIRHFRHWNAHSIFFWDPAGNLVEYIARHDLNNSEPPDFSGKSFQCISEIAFIVEDVEQSRQHLKNLLDIEDYRGGSSNFLALGSEEGLILLMKKGRVWEKQSPNSKRAEVFRTSIKINHNSVIDVSLNGYPYRIYSQGYD